MTTYTANDFEHARFATHPDGRVAARIGRDLPWVMPCIENCESVGLECNGLDHAPTSFMADEGWTPVREQPRPLTADAITDEMIQRARDEAHEWYGLRTMSTDQARGIIIAALTEPTRPEGAEKIEGVLHQYWSGDIDGDDLADRIAEEMNR